MSRRAVTSNRALLILCVALVAGWATVGASQNGQADSATSTAAPAAPSSAPATQDQLAQAQAIVDSGQKLSQRVLKAKAEAEKANDEIKTTCLNEKVSEINASVRSAEAQLEKLQQGAAASGPMSLLGVIEQALKTKGQEADACSGLAQFEAGETKLETQLDGNLIPSDQDSQVDSLPVTTQEGDGVGDPVVLTPAAPETASKKGDE